MLVITIIKIILGVYLGLESGVYDHNIPFPCMRAFQVTQDIPNKLNNPHSSKNSDNVVDLGDTAAP